MKKFIFGVMLLVSMLGIVRCSNPSNSDGSENVVYTVKNCFTDQDLKPISMNISYKNKSGVYTPEKNISYGETYEIPANDAKRDIKTIAVLGVDVNVPVIYLKIKVGDTEVEGFIQVDPEKVVKIKGVETTESGRFYHIEL